MKSLPERITAYAEATPILAEALQHPGTHRAAKQASVGLGLPREQRERLGHLSGCGIDPTGVLGLPPEPDRRWLELGGALVR